MLLTLPPGVSVLERGWLSSNSVLIQGQSACALVDSGYGLHAPQTLALVQTALQGRALGTLVNTHLHSDHCGGNATLQAAYPLLQTLIPPGQAQAVQRWDAVALSYTPTGQQCPQFDFNATLQPGSALRLGDLEWQVHAAPGHDPHSVVLWEPQSRTLISADALWERGFGVVFPELDGDDAFDEVAHTLDLIEALQPANVIPGHGAPFGGDAITPALAYARKRLQGFVDDPAKHLQYAAKVLLKFKLLEAQRIDLDALLVWARSTAYLTRLLNHISTPHQPQTQTQTQTQPHSQPSHQAAGSALAYDAPLQSALHALLEDLVRARAARIDGAVVYNV